MSRDLIDQRVVIDKFKEAGVEVIFSNHKVDDTPESDLMTDMQGAFSTFVIKQTVERSRREKRHRAKEGRVINIVPFGYKRIQHVDRDKTRVEINEEEAKIVKQIFIWIGQERISIREVIRRLRDRSIKTRKGKDVWNAVTILNMLKNTAYKGEIQQQHPLYSLYPGKPRLAVCPRIKLIHGDLVGAKLGVIIGGMPFLTPTPLF